MSKGVSRRDTTGPVVDAELLKLLGNESRIAVLQVLWDGFDFERYVVRDQLPLSFTELLERTGIEDSGNFNYHVGLLEERLIEKQEEGYVLTPLGYNLMRSILTYNSYEEHVIDPTELTVPCPFCDGTLVCSYDRELVRTYCRDCYGLAEGDISYVNLPVVNLGRAGLPEILDASTVQLMNRVRSTAYGFCGHCYRTPSISVDVCPAHNASDDAPCTHCNGQFGALMEVECHHCGNSGKGPLVELAIIDPETTVFFDERDRGPTALGPFHYRIAALEAASEVIECADEPHIVYEFAVGAETVAVRPAPDRIGI